MSTSISARRLGKELRDLQTNGCPVGQSIPVPSPSHSFDLTSHLLGIEIIEAEHFDSWTLSIEVLGETVYQVSAILLLTAMDPSDIPMITGREVRPTFRI